MLVVYTVPRSHLASDSRGLLDPKKKTTTNVCHVTIALGSLGLGYTQHIFKLIQTSSWVNFPIHSLRWTEIDRLCILVHGIHRQTTALLKGKENKSEIIMLNNIPSGKETIITTLCINQKLWPEFEMMSLYAASLWWSKPTWCKVTFIDPSRTRPEKTTLWDTNRISGQIRRYLGMK